MNKLQILGIDGKKKKDYDLPNFFSQRIREDIISKVLEILKEKHPYGPNPLAGMHSASGKIQHRRHVWKSAYGRGMSRIPRKIMSRKGTQFNWVGSDIPFAVGGRRAHPPKPESMINTRRINKKELEIALKSALSATANSKEISKRYERLNGKDLKMNLPFVIENKITELKTKELISTMKNVLGELYEVAPRVREVRQGRGKMRGRKYKSNAGLLIVTGKNEKIRTTIFDVVNTKDLTVTDLAKGGPGRLTIYTENAIDEIKDKFDGVKEKSVKPAKEKKIRKKQNKGVKFQKPKTEKTLKVKKSSGGKK